MSGEAASADSEEAKSFPYELSKIINEKGYKLEQIFNVDETALFWKKLPTKTFLASRESSVPGYKASKDRITILFGGNASGTHRLKPLVINKSLNPRCFGKNFKKSTLPVYWRANKKAWMTKVLFKEWFDDCFMPEVKKYCEDQNIQFKILLLVDNAGGHPDLSNDNVKFVFLPPNTTSLIQPMDQGVIATVKALYLKITMQSALSAVESGKKDLVQFWKDYNVLTAVQNIAKCWNKITERNLRGIWKNLIPECNDKINLNHDVVISREILEVGHSLNFEELDLNNIHECILSHSEPMDEGTLLDFYNENQFLDPDLEDNAVYDDDGEAIEPEIEPKETEISVSGIDEIMNAIELAKDAIARHDPNAARKSKSEDVLTSLSKNYKLLRDKKTSIKKQITLDSFFKKP